MTIYVDSSALLKRYVDEVDSPRALELLLADPVLATSWVTVVEMRRNLARLLDDSGLRRARAQFGEDLDAIALILVDEQIALDAAAIGETLGVRSLDAIHLASARRIEDDALTFLTFDLRQAQAARALGLSVVGA